MAVLNVLDVNAFLYTAHNVPELRKEVVRNCPVGGMHLILRKISLAFIKGESVVCAFDSKTDRKLKFPDYKSGRKKVPEVIVQAEALYKLLMDAGVCCVKINGLEADDIIYNVVEENLEKFSVINLHSSDYDLCHNVRAGHVNFLSINSNTLNVNGNNFAEVFSEADMIVPYNMITAKKVFCGDSSDSVPSFKAEDGRRGKVLYNKFVDIVFDNNVSAYLVKRSRQLIEVVASGLDLTEKDLEMIKLRCDLFYPYERKLDVVPSSKESVSMAAYCGMLASLKDRDSLKTMRLNVGPSPEVDQQLFEFGNSFKSGEFHVDRNLSINDFTLEESSVFIRGLWWLKFRSQRWIICWLILKDTFGNWITITNFLFMSM